MSSVSIYLPRLSCQESAFGTTLVGLARGNKHRTRNSLLEADMRRTILGTNSTIIPGILQISLRWRARGAGRQRRTQPLCLSINRYLSRRAPAAKAMLMILRWLRNSVPCTIILQRSSCLVLRVPESLSARCVERCFNQPADILLQILPPPSLHQE